MSNLRSELLSLWHSHLMEAVDSTALSRQPACLSGKEEYVREMMDRPFPVDNHGEPLSQAGQDACVQEMADRIVKGFGPKRIVPFGSRARGDHHPDSDLDFLVVVDGEPDTFEVAVDIRGVLFQSPLAKDIYVVPSAHWGARANATNNIVNCALADGAKTQYERR